MRRKHAFDLLKATVSICVSASSFTAIAAAPTYLNTSPLYADSGVTYHACNLVNVSTSPVTFYAKIIKSDGTNLATAGSNVTLQPGVSYELGSSENYTGFARCQFTVNGDPAAVRANATVFFHNSDHYEAVSFSEAR